MTLDLTTVAAMTSLVVVVAGVMFILETLLREDNSVSRIWALGFLSGIASSVAYVIWALDPAIWWSVVVGNAALVATGGFMWLGCRRFNGRRIGWAGLVVALWVLLTAAAVLISGESGGGWAGAWAMFISLAILPGAAAVEAARGALRRIRLSTVLVVVFTVESLYYAGRTVVLLMLGEQSDIFVIWWGTVPTSVLTVVLTVVAVVVASVLRAERAALRGAPASARSDDLSEVVNGLRFQQLLDVGLGRIRGSSERLAVLAVRIAGIQDVTTAFGIDEANEIRTALGDALRDGAPVQAWIGYDADDTFLVAIAVDAEGAEQQAEAKAIQLRTLARDTLDGVDLSVNAGSAVGVAVAAPGDLDGARLIERARAATGEEGTLDDAQNASLR